VAKYSEVEEQILAQMLTDLECDDMDDLSADGQVKIVAAWADTDRVKDFAVWLAEYQRILAKMLDKLDCDDLDDLSFEAQIKIVAKAATAAAK
jgi:ribosomal protein L12E/L44/L45/RPP1/RPP2